MQRGPILQSPMVCQDARRAFPYMVAGEIPLTEWALLERHVGGCGECRTELGRLREEAAARLRARKRHTIRVALMATVVLVVAAGSGLYLHSYGVPWSAGPDSLQLSTPSSPAPPAVSTPAVAKPRPRPTAPAPPVDRPPATDRAPRSAPPAAPPPTVTAPVKAAPTIAPPPASKPEPPKPELASEPAPAPLPPVSTPPPAPLPAPAPATAAAPPPSAPAASAPDERMPTQAATGRAITAAPTAEAMPTQGQPPARSRP